MNFRNISIKIILALVVASFTLYSCNDYNDLDFDEPSGDADFSNVVAVGNSLTAGYQSDALYRTAQRYSFPNIVAGQIETVQQFNQPLISNPGISLGNGRLELDGTLSPTDPANTPTPTGDSPGTLMDQETTTPYNNIGIPGALLADFTGQDLPGQPYSARRSANPFFDLVLGQTSTQAQQLVSTSPSFVMFWLGNNEVLGYVTSGGNTPYVPGSSFQQLYGASMQAVNQTGADAVLYNIPNVTTIPYVFLINQLLLQEGTISVNQSNDFALSTPQGDIPIWIQTTDPNNPGVVQDTVMMNAPNPAAGQPGAFFLYPAQSQLSQLFGQGVGTTPSNPIPHSLVLDNGETTQAIQLVSSYNQAIQSLAAQNNFPVVDINTAFSSIVSNGGISTDGITLTPVPGSLFSLDGVHPSNRGHGIVANLTIEAINNAYNTNLQTVDVSKIPQGIPVSN